MHWSPRTVVFFVLLMLLASGCAGTFGEITPQVAGARPPVGAFSDAITVVVR